MSVRYDIPFRNSGTQAAPAFGVLEVDTIELDDDREIVVVKRPEEDGSGVFILNGPIEVSSGDLGKATASWGARALYDESNSPATGEGYSPKLESFELEPASEDGAFTIIGLAPRDSAGVVRVATVGGGGGKAISVAVAMFVDTVPAFASIDGAAAEVEFGRLTDGAIILDFERDSSGNLVDPPVRFTAMMEEDPNNTGTQIRKLRTAINLTGTPVRGSSDEPVVLPGELRKVGESEYFVVHRADMRALADYVRGSDPLADALSIYIKGGERVVRWGRAECQTSPGA